MQGLNKNRMEVTATVFSEFLRQASYSTILCDFSTNL